jgi:hemerythrin-like metal-binding protein
MDAQHQRLFDIINSIYDAVDSGASFHKLQSIFKDVFDFTAYHFAKEEALLEQQSFPKLGEHKIIHQQLVQRVQELMEDLKAEQPGSPEKVKLFLKN